MPKLITQYVTCPKCNGTSNNTKGLVCPECGGIGLGTFLKNDFLYWGYDLKPAKIIVRQSQLIFNYLVCAFCLAAGLGGFFYLIIWLRDNTFAVSNSFLKQLGALLSFWGEKHNFILFFWIGVLFIMFAYFYYARIKERNPKVKLRSYTRQNKLNKKTQVIPNNWQELKRFKTKIDVSKSCEESLLKIIEKSYELAKQSRHEE